MRYFATADDQETAGKIAKDNAGGMTEVEEQILGTWYIHSSLFLFTSWLISRYVFSHQSYYGSLW